MPQIVAAERSIYDLITVIEEDELVILEDIKPITEIHEELTSSNVMGLLSFYGGIRLSHILNKLQLALRVIEDAEEDTSGSIDNVLTEAERSFLYGIYLIR